MSSFAIPLSGMLANEQALNVISDNIANSNTQGFKSNSVLFEDAMNEASASLQIGAGVGSTLTTRNFTQGSVHNTGGALNAAIQGGGFFVMQNSAGTTTYTRDGSFSLSPAGQLVSSDGSLVQGWTAVNGVVNPSGAVSSISVPTLSSQAPTPTTNMTLAANLNASAKVLSPYDITKAVVTVTEVRPTGDNVTAKVVWSQSLNGTARTTGTTVTLPTSLTGVPTTSGLILGEATYFYTPNLGYTISGTVALSDSYYLYPRQTNFVPTITSGTTPPVPGTSCPTS